jgi:hypothetical protein
MDLPPPPPTEGRFKRFAKKLAYQYGKKPAPEVLLRSQMRHGEKELAQARGWE